MIFEMTLDYSVILPMTMTVDLSYGTRTLLSRESIYQMKLSRRNRHIPAAPQANLCSMPGNHAISCRRRWSSDSLEVLARRSEEYPDVRWFLVNKGGHIAGIAQRDYAMSVPDTELRGWHPVADVMQRDFIVAREEQTMDSIVVRMHRPHAAVVVTLSHQGSPDAADAVGIITWERVAELLEETVELFSVRGKIRIHRNRVSDSTLLFEINPVAFLLEFSWH